MLRVRGVPATLCFELHDLRTGNRHLFRRSEAVLEFLLRHGRAAEEPDGTPANARSTKDPP